MYGQPLPEGGELLRVGWLIRVAPTEQGRAWAVMALQPTGLA